MELLENVRESKDKLKFDSALFTNGLIVEWVVLYEGVFMKMSLEDEVTEVSALVTERLMKCKYRLIFSEKLERKVYTLIEWIDKPLFKKYKKLFGYTDIGWTVKHPKQLIRALISDGIWSADDDCELVDES